MKIPYWQLIFIPAVLFTIGFCMNSLAVVSNHGQMVVHMPGGCAKGDFDKDRVHACMLEDSHLKILSDWILFDEGVYSPGDGFIEAANYSYLPFLYMWVALILKDYNN